mmetsp:Transcript_1845/g.3294  ORF Transcript_1845/g.3294 Transcript_1845/m.3294 type:complete len:140 (-) Transcript_1845:84-503(-)
MAHGDRCNNTKCQGGNGGNDCWSGNLRGATAVKWKEVSKRKERPSNNECPRKDKGSVDFCGGNDNVGFILGDSLRLFVGTRTLFVPGAIDMPHAGDDNDNTGKRPESPRPKGNKQIRSSRHDRRLQVNVSLSIGLTPNR